MGALFEEEKPDPNQVINDKLDKITGKLDQVLANQEGMMKQINVKFDQMNEHFKKVNERLIAIAQKLDQKEIVELFNNRNEKYYNPLKVQNQSYFDAAYKLYNDNKSDLSKVSSKLGEYGKAWVDDNEQYLKLTWQYIEYLSTVQHTKYGTGMDKIYDGLTYDKYPWEHLATADRLSYRSYDTFMITRCLFMISLYATYCDLSDVKKDGIYNNYNIYKDKFKEFSLFQATDPDKFRVCQIPGAHFVMHKELQKYNFKGKNNECPHPNLYGLNAIYRPEWHSVGSIKIENPAELRSKLIREKEMLTIYNYYTSAEPHFIRDYNRMKWMDILVGHMDIKMPGGAEYAEKPGFYTYPDFPTLLLYDWEDNKKSINGVLLENGTQIWMGPSTMWSDFNMTRDYMGTAEIKDGKAQWIDYINKDYYAAIVEKRF